MRRMFTKRSADYDHAWVYKQTCSKTVIKEKVDKIENLRSLLVHWKTGLADEQLKLEIILQWLAAHRDYKKGVHYRAGDWVGYPTYCCKTQSLGKSFTMHDPILWAQLNNESTQTQWAWVL